ncbi:hypothetical protein V2J09_007380 [Rumex salicifolius]
MNYSYCVYDSDIATGYGVGAFLFLMASQNTGAYILTLETPLTFFIAEVCLLAGSTKNAYHTKYRTFYGDQPPSCQTLRKGVFAAGASFVFFTAILSEFYYVFYSKARENFQAFGGEAGVGLGSYNCGILSNS